MQTITKELQLNPREIHINIIDKTWWELGSDGEDYETTVDPEIYLLVLKKYERDSQESGELVVKSERYGYRIHTTPAISESTEENWG